MQHLSITPCEYANAPIAVHIGGSHFPQTTGRCICIHLRYKWDRFIKYIFVLFHVPLMVGLVLLVAASPCVPPGCRLLVKFGVQRSVQMSSTQQLIVAIEEI